MTIVNLNARVRVKLTDHARAMMEREHARLWRDHDVRPAFKLPHEDAEGWSTWQLWEVMQKVAPALSMGARPVFELNQFEIIEP